MCTSQPIEDAIASQDVALEKIAEPNDDSSFADMQGSESSLKVIENKLEYWLKKYYKKTEKMNNNSGIIHSYLLLWYYYVLLLHTQFKFRFRGIPSN